MYRCRIEGSNTCANWEGLDSPSQAAEIHAREYGGKTSEGYVIVEVLIIIGMETVLRKYRVDINVVYEATEIEDE